MNPGSNKTRRTCLALGMFVFGTAAVLSEARTAMSAAPEGLVAVESRRLDELYLRPDASIATYRKVYIDPAVVALKPNWLRDQNATRDVRRWLVPEDAQNIVDAATSSMEAAIAKVFAERGYEVAAAPGPGVLRITPSVSELDVFAPDVPSPGKQAYFTYDAVGTATLRLQIRDSVTGTLLGQVIDRDAAREVHRLSRTNGASNRFWFDALFTTWAGNCVAAIGAAPVR